MTITEKNVTSEMNHMEMIITFKNGAIRGYPQSNMASAYNAANKVSTSGGRVSRIEVKGDGLRVLWDASWNDESKVAGLKLPL